MVDRHYFWLPLIILCFWGTYSCGTADGPAANWVVTSQTLDASDMPATMFASGDTIKIMLSVENDSESDQILSFPSVNNFEFIITGPNLSSVVVWHWSMDSTYTNGTISLLFAAGETMSQPVSWDQKNDSNASVLAGTYEIRAIVLNASYLNTGDAGNLRAPVLEITITP